MLLDLTELVTGKVREKTYQATLSMETVESQGAVYPVISSDPLNVRVITTGTKKYLVESEGRIVLHIPCGRCLQDVATQVEFQLERELDFEGKADEEHIDDQLEDMSYVDGYHLDLDAMALSEILMNLPYRVLCKEDCKGLCLKCGANLNLGDCGCDRVALDPRMAAIQDIFKNAMNSNESS